MKRTAVVLLSLFLCMCVLAGCGPEKIMNMEMYEKVAGTWYPDDPEDHSTYELYENGTYVYKGRYELEGQVMSGVDTPGTFEITDDKIIFQDEEAADEYQLEGYLDEDFTLHIGECTFHQ